MSSYGNIGKIDMSIMSHGLNNVRPSHNVTAQPYRRIQQNTNQPSNRPPMLNRSSSVAAKQQMINQQIRSQGAQYGGKTPIIPRSNSQPSSKSFFDAGFRYMQ